MLKHMVFTLLACLSAVPAQAATFTYTGAPFPGATGFRRITLQFSTPSAVAPNTTYSVSKFTAFSDGVNKLPAITSYLAKGKAYGGALNSFLYATITTGPTGQPVSWLFKVNVFFTDPLGNEGYDLVVAGPGNTASEPGVFDSLYTTLPETLPGTVSVNTARYGTLTVK